MTRVRRRAYLVAFVVNSRALQLSIDLHPLSLLEQDLHFVGTFVADVGKVEAVGLNGALG